MKKRVPYNAPLIDYVNILSLPPEFVPSVEVQLHRFADTIAAEQRCDKETAMTLVFETYEEMRVRIELAMGVLRLGVGEGMLFHQARDAALVECALQSHFLETPFPSAWKKQHKVVRRYFMDVLILFQLLARHNETGLFPSQHGLISAEWFMAVMDLLDRFKLAVPVCRCMACAKACVESGLTVETMSRAIGVFGIPRVDDLLAIVESESMDEVLLKELVADSRLVASLSLEEIKRLLILHKTTEQWALVEVARACAKDILGDKGERRHEK